MPSRRRALHDLAELGLTQHPEIQIAAHVDVAEAKARGEARVCALAVEVVVELGPRQREHVPVTGAVDDDGRREREPSLLALEDHSLDGVVARDRRHHPTVHERVHVRLADDVVGDELQDLGIHGGRPMHRVPQRCRTDAPVGGFDGVLRTPDLGGRSEGCVWAAPVDELRADAGHDEVPVPVGHPIDPRHETAGRQAAQVVVSLHQHGVGPEAAGRDGRGRAGRPASDDQHVAAAVDGGRPGRLVDRRTWLRLHDPLPTLGLRSERVTGIEPA